MTKRNDIGIFQEMARMTDENPQISIVIPIFNEERFIAQTIHDLLNQDYPPDRVEILVVVAPSTDRTEDIVKKIAAGDPRVKYFANPHRLSSGARTIGAKAACGDIILFIDGHVYIDNNQLLRNTVRLMKEKQVSVLSRPQLLDTPNNSFFQRAVSLARASWIGHGRDSTIYSREEKYVSPSSSGASYRQEVFDKVGYFDLSFDACEDVEFNHRCAEAGFQSYTSMDLAVYYYPRSSLYALFRQMTRYGTGRYRLACKHPKTLSLTTLFPSLLVVGLILPALLGFAWTAFFIPSGGLAALYLGMILICSLSLARHHGWAYSFVLPGVYCALHIGLGWGFLREMGSAMLRKAVPIGKRSPTKSNIRT